MNLTPQDKVVFTLLPNGTTIMGAKTRSIKSLAGKLRSNHKRVAVIGLNITDRQTSICTIRLQTPLVA